MRSSSALLLIGPAVFVAAAFAPAPPGPPDYKRDILPLLTKYCGPCHGNKDNADMSLAFLQTAESLKTQRPAWERIQSALSSKKMPPPGNPAPTQPERDKLVAFIRGALGADKPNPGRVTMRRLNREEYNNTVRDLLGVDFRPADDFPSDDVGYGFDNIGDVLSMSPLLMDKYLKAAQDIAQAALGPPKVHGGYVQGADLEAPNAVPIENGGLMLYSNGEARHEFKLPVEGDYRLRVQAAQDKGGPDDARMALRLNGGNLKVVAVSARRRRPAMYEIQFHAPAGGVTLGAAFTNDYYVPKTATSPEVDRNLAIYSLEVEGPITVGPGSSASRDRILFAEPTNPNWVDCERKVLAAIANRGYRRPATKAEVDKVVSIAELAHKNGETYERAIQLGITAILCSPNFLFRVEKPAGGTLGPYEVASRLSYFLWSSMPDDELFALAAKNQLQKPDVVAHEVARMLKEPKAGALADNFAGQWLQTRKLTVVRPDRKLFPAYDDDVRRAMATETRMFFEDVVQNDRSILDFIDGRYSFVNGALARVYGIGGVSGSRFERIQLPPERAGVITQGSVLVVTSNPTRTSPVKRGKWILENILGTPPPPPPPGVGVLKEDTAATSSSSLRQRMEEHRKDPMCAACHKQMDGLGFALENFDAIGAWRTKDGPFDIDASGELPDGSKFTGPAELRSILLRKKNLFVRCLSEKMLTYALGRGLESYDDMAVDKIVRTVSNGDYKFSVLVKAVVESDPFRKSRAEGR
ncbi:MAG: DUF1592 domain-containing protein [Fimbriimonadales bacterium]